MARVNAKSSGLGVGLRVEEIKVEWEMVESIRLVRGPFEPVVFF